MDKKKRVEKLKDGEEKREKKVQDGWIMKKIGKKWNGISSKFPPELKYSQRKIKYKNLKHLGYTRHSGYIRQSGWNGHSRYTVSV